VATGKDTLFDMKPILIGSSYKPGRGGHAPGDLRNAFLEALDAYESWEDGAAEPDVELRDRQVKLSAVAGLLWNCSDIVPSVWMQQVRDLDTGDESFRIAPTYAAVARWLKAHVALALRDQSR
jgi:hypothetical protein